MMNLRRIMFLVLAGSALAGGALALGAVPAQAGPAAAALNLVGTAAGFASSKLFGVSRADGLTIAIEVGIKNATVGLMITLTFLKSAEIAIPSAVYGILMFAFGGLLVLFGRRQSPPSHASLPQ